MKVLFVHDSYFYKVSDNQYYSIHLTNEVLERYLQLGNHVTFLGRKKDNLNVNKDKTSISTLDSTKSSIITLPNFKSLKGYVKHIKLVEKVVENAVKEHDIILARIPSALGSLAVNLAVKYDKALLGEIVGCTYDGYKYHSLFGKFIAPYFLIKQKLITKKLSYAMYVTKDYLQKRYPSKGQVIDCSDVVIKNCNHRVLENRINKIKNLKENDIVVMGTIGTLDIPYKGQKLVLKSLKQISGKRKFIYKVVGSGNVSFLKDYAKKLEIEDKLDIIGIVNHEDINKFLDEIDLYIQPSYTEGLPRALIEAISRGLPAIGSNVGGIPELLGNEALFERGDVFQLTNIIESFNKEKMIKQSKVNYLKSKEYTIDVINKRRKLFYKMFLKENFKINE